MNTAAVTRRNKILERALSLDPRALVGFLDEACAGNSTLRRELERLLDVHAQMATWSLAPSGACRVVSFDPGRWLGRYELQDMLGCGGMGVVYRAYDPVIGRMVAVKVLTRNSDRMQSSRFLSELRILGSLVHDNVVRVYDYGGVDDVRYIVMELLEGEDLGHAIARGTCRDLTHKLEIMRQVAAALEHIHAAGIVHRDLKPANVFVESCGRVKLMDFGIAQSEDAVGVGSGEVIGTPQYMAPEQLMGVPGGPSMDVYSFAIVLFELLTGHRPFPGDSPSELLSNIASQAIPIGPLVASGVPEHLIELIRCATSKEPAKRPQSFSEIVKILEGTVGPPKKPRAVPIVRSSRRWLFAAASCSLIAILSLSGFRTGPNGAAAAGVAAESSSAILPTATIVAAATALIPASAAPNMAIQLNDPLQDKQPRHIERRVEKPSGRPIVRRDDAGAGGDSSRPPPFANPGTDAARTFQVMERERLADVNGPPFQLVDSKYETQQNADGGRDSAATQDWGRLHNSEDPLALRASYTKDPRAADGDAAARLARELDARDEAQREVLALLERYAAANRVKNIREIAMLWPTLDADRLRTMAGSFAHAEKLEFTLEADGEPELSEPATRSAYASASYRGEAVVACRRRVQMIDRSGVRPEPSESRVAIRLTRVANKWAIASID